jgi:hypothetical protein
MTVALISIAVVCLAISLWAIISKIIRIKTSDKITLVKEGKSITISTNPTKEERVKLYNF